MRRIRVLTGAALVLLALTGALCARAAPEPRSTVASVAAQIEIGFLLGYIDGSGCEFYRNGSWHAANAAQEHLRGKYRAAAALDQIASAEDFIEKIATRSSLTGESYAVRCAGGASMSSAAWLRAELTRLRGL
jgi:ABC-type sugar transport system substrate-binding protein